MKRWLVIVVVALALVVSARAQQAPQGNAHPQAQMLSTDARGSGNPFGPVAAPTMTPLQKHAFSKQVDLAPLRDLAVLHNGRVKILDSLARETIGTVCGRKDYREPRDWSGSATMDFSGASVYSYDPLFTLLDMVIDKGYYVDKPLIGINYLPLRTRLIELSVQDPQQRERWKRLGRLTPEMIARHRGEVLSGPLDAQLNSAMGGAEDAVSLYLDSLANLEMVAPARADEPWSHLSTLSADHPVRVACEKLGAAWRAGDAPGVNAAAKDLASLLPAINPGQYPTTRRTLERLYNAARPFEWGMWLYALSLLGLLLALGTGRGWLSATGLTLLLGAVLMHAGGFGVRCVIAERFAIQNQFESMTGVSLFAAIVGLCLALWRRQWLFGAGVAAVGFMVLVVATQTGIPGSSINREAAILNTSVLLKYHVTTVLLSYGLISLGMVLSLFYLAAHYFGRRQGEAIFARAVGDAPATGPARVLHDLDKAQMTVLQLAFWALGVGILLGAWWADHSWGRWWAFDPKELWALLTWIVYLVVIHVRVAGVKNKALTTAWLSVLGFIVMLWCYFGVNLLLPGLHAYA